MCVATAMVPMAITSYLSVVAIRLVPTTAKGKLVVRMNARPVNPSTFMSLDASSAVTRHSHLEQSGYLHALSILKIDIINYRALGYSKPHGL